MSLLNLNTLTQLSNFDNLPVSVEFVFRAYLIVTGGCLLRFKKLLADGGTLALLIVMSLSGLLEVLHEEFLELRPEFLLLLRIPTFLPGVLNYPISMLTKEARAFSRF